MHNKCKLLVSTVPVNITDQTAHISSSSCECPAPPTSVPYHVHNGHLCQNKLYARLCLWCNADSLAVSVMDSTNSRIIKLLFLTNVMRSCSCFNGSALLLVAAGVFVYIPSVHLYSLETSHWSHLPSDWSIPLLLSAQENSTYSSPSSRHHSCV